MSRRLLVINPVNHPGGAETTLMRLLGGLQPRGWEITLTTPGRGPLASEAELAGYNWQPLALGGILRGQGARALRSWPRARALADQHDIVYLNGGVTGRLLPAVSSDSRTVLHIHDMVTKVPRIWRLADLVFADSHAVAARLAGLDAAVVHLPVDLDPPAAPCPWDRESGPVVGFIGRIEPRKGVLDLVQATPALRRLVPGVQVVIVGDDPYQTTPRYLQEVLGSAAAEGIAHFPWSENAPGLMRHLDVLVLPSYEEPFGTVLAEAMAVGTPVVATRVDGLPEVVEDGVSGRLVAAGDPPALAAAIAEVLADHERMAGAARERAQRFGLERYVDRVERLLS
jgi:glycosyltransferase involved in cell wall biosynthesis